MSSLPPAIADKIVDHATLLERRRAARARGVRVVQCHGCFDIVHPGHIRHLRFARAQGDLLLVSITGDAEMRKGTGRPLIPEELRAENLAALDCVDMVYIEPRPTAAELLAEVEPDVYIKGREYETNNDPRFLREREIVERAGGTVVFSSGDVVFSSTALIAALEESADPFHARLRQLCRDEALEGSNLYTLISAFRGRRAVVIGESILDTYVMCDRPDVAGESPVMTLRPLHRRRYDGGAAVIARHLAALGARPTLVTALPESPDADQFRQRLAAEGIDVRALPVAQPMAEKQRFLVGTQKVMKLDLVEPIVLDTAQQERFTRMALEACASSPTDAAIIADFGLGLFTPVLMTRLCEAVRPRTRILSGDVSGRRSNLLSMRGMDLLCPSESELRDSTRLLGEALPLAAFTLLQETRSARAIVTLGADGLIAFEPRAAEQAAAASSSASGSFLSRLRGEHVPALGPVAVDALGCGDALLTTSTLALASGASMLQASFLGAAAAAVQVQRLGNVPVSASDLRHQIARTHAAHLAYAAPETIETRSALAARV
ncbi:MAG: PfkB family carbohydrate kinase [Planctomycetota bacterium]|nr:PfkB family carbohydrate kinase [Planctomycetota bacterium]